MRVGPPIRSRNGRTIPERRGASPTRAPRPSPPPVPLACAPPPSPEIGLHLAEGLLYGVEVRRVGRQEPQLAPPPLDRLAHPLGFVGAQVVHHHDPSRPHRGRQQT